MADHVTIFEMGPRDGLQNEKRLIPTADKIRLVDLLTACGFKKIETASFVSPKWVPPDGRHRRRAGRHRPRPGRSLHRAHPQHEGLRAGAGVKGRRGRRLRLGLRRVQPVEHQPAPLPSRWTAWPRWSRRHSPDGIPVRGYVSCVVACPFDGPVDPGVVADLTGKLLAMGCYEVSLGDTIGTGTPETIAAMLDAVLAVAPAAKLAGHYHDTNGRACDNIESEPGQGPAHLRRRHRRAGRLPVRARVQGQRRNRGGHRPRRAAGLRDRHRPHEAGRGRRLRADTQKRGKRAA